MAEEDITCPRCTDIYCLPVLLKCGHNICKVCLFNYWEWKGLRECPVCGVVSDTGRPTINLALHNVAKEHKVLMMTSNQDKCSQHNEKLKIFCHNDGELICLICQLSKKHKVHECSPVKEAAGQKKAEISASLESLQKKLKILKNTKEEWEETKTYIKTQSYKNETAIKEEFKKFHQLLQEEENARLKALKLEEETKTQIMCKKLENISDQINTLTSTISDTEKALKAQDIQLLQDYKKTKKGRQCNIGEPEVIRDILINSAKHLGLLSFQIWKKMKDIVKCVPVVLDPNTAQSNLEFSKELSCVQYSSKRILPNNPERITNRVSVLGATGFTSGKHSWTVDVGQGKDWYIGVALDSIQRMNTIFLNPAEGFWVIGLSNGDSLCAQTTPRSKLPMKDKPKRITVELDYERGKVIFINAADSTKIHTFKDRFTEKVFPYFAPGLCEDKKSSKLTICPQDYKKTKKRLQWEIGEPEVIREILINSAKHLGWLSFEIWKKMEDIVRCVPVVLDPNTAQSNLEFSEELSCVQYSSKKLLPNNPECLISRISVLGATGFTSGKHCWTVDVGQGKDWSE